VKRSDGRRSKTVLFNLLIMIGALALETFGAELEAAPLVRKILVFALAAVNIGLRFVTTMPLEGRTPPPPPTPFSRRGPGSVLLVFLVLGCGVLAACGPLRYTCDRAPEPGPTYRFDAKANRTVLVAPCDTDAKAVILSWPGKVKLRTNNELAPPPKAKPTPPPPVDEARQ